MQTLRAALTVLAAALAGVAAADEAATAKQVLQASGLRAGLCLHVGCGRSESAGLTAALAESPAWFVHGLAFDDAALARARKAIEAKGVAGRAMAEKLEAAPLPYLPDLANLVVVEDLASLSAKGVTKEDLLRVVAPEGILCVREGGTWKKTAKPRPKEMDVWSHTYHGADGNLVSNDRVVKFPIGFRWIEGLPVNLNQWAACRGWIVMNGRCYALSSNEPENLPPSRTRDHYLSARDAFNGLPLWKVNLGTTDNGAFLTWRNAASLAADEKRVYAPAKEKAIAADADTGKVVATYATKYPPVRLVLLDKILVVTSWEDREPTKLKYEGESLWATWVPKTDNGSVEAFDAESGKPKWALPYPANQILAADGTVYLISQKGNPPTERFVAAVDLKTGKERWRLTHTSFGEDPDLQLNCAGPGWVVIAKRRGKDKDNDKDRRAIHVLGAADGKTLWSISPAGATWTPVVDGLLWHGNKKYDPKTGEVKGTIATGIPDQGCTPSSIIGASILTHSRGCGYVEIPAEGKGGAKGVQYGGARGGCMEGMIAANGMLYTSQNNCRCAPGQIYGFLGIAVVALDPATGETRWAKALASGKRMNDLLCLRDGSIAWHHLRLDPKTGAVKPPAAEPKDFTQGGILDGTWTRVGKRRSGNAFLLGKLTADLLAWDGALAAAPGFALTREKAEAGSVKESAWRPALPNNTQVEAIALAGNAAVYAVRAKDPKPGEPEGFVCVFASADGKKVAEFPLEAAPTYDGLAVTKDRIVVSLWNGSVVCLGK